MSKFFIRRPIVAIVIAMLTVIVGAVAIVTLPVAQFPNIVPPEIQILATYVGADARTLEQAVATPIEQQVNGVDNMNYMYSLNATGSSSTTLVTDFDVKTDPNTDLILTQSRENLAASPTSGRSEQLRSDDPQVRDRAPHADRSLLSAGHARREIPFKLRLHQLERSYLPFARNWPVTGFWRGTIRHAGLA